MSVSRFGQSLGSIYEVISFVAAYCLTLPLMFVRDEFSRRGLNEALAPNFQQKIGAYL